MRILSALLFDDLISTTASTWYSSSETWSQMGGPDVIALQACARGVAGTVPTLTIQAQHSNDSQLWLNVSGSPEISATLSTTSPNETITYGQVNFVNLLSYVRFKITLGGTSPQCFLRLYGTGRAKAGS